MDFIKIKNFCCFFFKFLFWATPWSLRGSWFPSEGLNPARLQWKPWVLTTDHQGSPKNFCPLKDSKNMVCFMNFLVSGPCYSYLDRSTFGICAADVSTVILKLKFSWFQYCVSFWYIAKWFSYTYICIYLYSFLFFPLWFMARYWM